MRWLVSMPAWGERAIRDMLSVSLPATAAALDGRRATFLVHTDQPHRIAPAVNAIAGAQCLIMRPANHARSHEILGHAHRDALRLAHEEKMGAIAFINADMVPSIEIFDAAERRFAQGHDAIVMAATRTIGATPPIAASSAELLRWTMAHPHPAVAECVWGQGKSTVPWAIYFMRGDDCVLHGFHLHPFAVKLNGKRLYFGSRTIDGDLIDRFPPERVHVVTDAHECAFAEMSPPERVFPLRPMTIDEASVAYWARKRAGRRHRDLFRRRITITGNGVDIGDGAVVERILGFLQ